MEQQVDDVGGREGADGIATQRGAVSGAGQVQQRVSVATTGVQFDQLVQGLLQRVILHAVPTTQINQINNRNGSTKKNNSLRVQLRLDLGQQEYQVDDDAQRAVEVG